MKFSVGALVVLARLPKGPDSVSIRDLAGQIFDDKRFVMRGKINRFISELWQTKWIFRVTHGDQAPHQKVAYGVKKAYYSHAMRLLQEHDIPEHLDKSFVT